MFHLLSIRESSHALPTLAMHFLSPHALSLLLVVSNTEQLARGHFYARLIFVRHTAGTRLLR